MSGFIRDWRLRSFGEYGQVHELVRILCAQCFRNTNVALLKFFLGHHVARGVCLFTTEDENDESNKEISIGVSRCK